MAQRYGKIVNVGGTFGMRGRAGRMAYSASKWGLRGITKSFALEVGAYNINVNCVAPGMVDGPRFRDKVCADMAKRLGITVEEAARAPRRRLCAASASRPTTTSPMPACSWPATPRARSPASTFRSMAAGPCCEEAMMSTADLVIRGGKVVSPGLASSRRASPSRTARSSRSAPTDAMPPARETLDAHGHACAARRDRRARAFPRSRLSAQGGFRERHGGGGVRRRHHRVRHAEHDPADRHARNSRRQAQDGSREGARRFRPLCAARRRHDRARAGAGRRAA